MKIKLPSPRKRQVMLYSSLRWVSYICAGIAAFFLLYIILFVIFRGVGSISWNFLFGDYKLDAPTIRPALIGTLYIVLIAILIAAPIGIFTAIFLTEYKIKSGLLNTIRVSIETLAGIPSIVYGLFGYIVFVGLFGWGASILAGGITISIMILPIIIRTTEEAILSVPPIYREGAYALGSSKTRTIFRVVLPAASGGIVSAMILAVGRVISESAVLLLTIGMVVYKDPSLLSPGTTLALDVYYFASYGYPAQAAATGAVLLFLVLGINLLATLIGKLMSRGRLVD